MSDYQEILVHASKLPVGERLRLIDDLTATVTDEQSQRFSEEWSAEIKRRGDEIDSGSVKTEDWLVIRERLFAKHGISNAG